MHTRSMEKKFQVGRIKKESVTIIIILDYFTFKYNAEKIEHIYKNAKCKSLFLRQLLSLGSDLIAIMSDCVIQFIRILLEHIWSTLGLVTIAAWLFSLWHSWNSLSGHGLSCSKVTRAWMHRWMHRIWMWEKATRLKN